MSTVTLYKDSVDRLLGLSTPILNKHLELAKYELTDKDKYDSTLKDILLAEELESQIFNSINPDDIFDSISYLANGLESVNFVDNLIPLVENEDLFLNLRRQIYRFIYRRIIIDNFFGEDNCKHSERISLPYPLFKIKSEFEMDTYNRLIYYVNEEIKKEENKDIVDDLLKFKYYLLFVSRAIYKDSPLRFDDSKRLTICTSLKRLLSLDDEAYEMTQNNFNIERINKCINNIISVNDYGYNEENKIRLDLRKCLLKAILTGFSLREVELGEKAYTDLFKSLKGRILYSNYSIATDSILECYSDAKKDKAKIIER